MSPVKDIIKPVLTIKQELELIKTTPPNPKPMSIADFFKRKAVVKKEEEISNNLKKVMEAEESSDL